MTTSYPRGGAINHWPPSKTLSKIAHSPLQHWASEGITLFGTALSVFWYVFSSLSLNMFVLLHSIEHTKASLNLNDSFFQTHLNFALDSKACFIFSCLFYSSLHLANSTSLSTPFLFLPLVSQCPYVLTKKELQKRWMCAEKQLAACSLLPVELLIP